MLSRRTIGCFILIILTSAALRSAQAQGILPPVSSSTTVQASDQPLLIGESLSHSLAVLDSSGTERALYSFKSPLDVFVVEFLSSNCADDQKAAGALRKLYENYHGWHVAYVALAPSPDENANLAAFLTKNAIPSTMVTDPKGLVRRALKLTATPEVLIFDEAGVLRYRGPVTGPARADEALDTIIGHVESVPTPEPANLPGCRVP